MKEYDIAVFLSVFNEMLGPLLWVLVLTAAVVTVGFIAVVIRDRSISGRRIARAEIAGVVGGIAAVFLMQAVTHSSFRDVGGAIDLLLVIAIWLAGTVVTTLLVYLAQNLRRERSA